MDEWDLKKCFDRFLRYNLSKEELQAKTLQNMKNNITDLKNFLNNVLLNKEKLIYFSFMLLGFGVAMKLLHTEACWKCLISNLMKLIHKYNIRRVHIFIWLIHAVKIHLTLFTRFIKVYLHQTGKYLNIYMNISDCNKIKQKDNHFENWTFPFTLTKFQLTLSFSSYRFL